jgi:2-desacetyl-2-hydroxyethyl bacteriochlorophyllide A dehydrogenase
MRQVRAPLSIEEVDLPHIGPYDALVETRTSGICGTDLHILEGHGYVPALPHILGHEPAGVVVEVGSEVDGLKAGDRVVPHLFLSCGACFYCRAGKRQQCSNVKGIIGVLSHGAFAEYFKAPAQNFYKLPSSVPFDQGGLIADAVVTAVHASRRAQLGLRDTALVLGAGGVGQILLQILKSSGVRVAAADIDAGKCHSSLALGASMAVDPRAEDARERILDFSGAAGVECVFNCAGSSATMRFAADVVMRCGRIVVIGEEPQDPRIDTIEIAQRELEIIGSRNGTPQDMVDAIRWVESGAVTPIIGARFPLDEVNAAFACMRGGAPGRVVVTIKESSS